MLGDSSCRAVPSCNVQLSYLVTSADPIRPKLSHGGSVPCIGYMC